MATIINIKGTKEAPKSQRSSMETRILSIDAVLQWLLPPFQRPLRVNAKVLECSEITKQSETIEGVITLGQLAGQPEYFIVDGQHRIEAFKLSGLKEALADVRIITFDNMGEMADEFARLNSSMVKMRPDDILRAMESSTLALQMIRKHCDFVGYDQVRRNGNSAILSMSVVIRCWTGSSSETPTATFAGHSAATLARSIDESSTRELIQFLTVAHTAWGRDHEYYRLWSQINLTLCMWLWKRLVLNRDRIGGKRVVVLSATEFKHCLMGLSANSDYLAWLVGRNMTDRDRSPAYIRIKSIFVRRLGENSSDKRKFALPAPAWSSR